MCNPDVLMWEARKLIQYDAILMFIIPLSLCTSTSDDEQNECIEHTDHNTVRQDIPACFHDSYQYLMSFNINLHCLIPCKVSYHAKT